LVASSASGLVQETGIRKSESKRKAY
jgi:hypothetical protein